MTNEGNPMKWCPQRGGTTTVVRHQMSKRKINEALRKNTKNNGNLPYYSTVRVFNVK